MAFQDYENAPVAKLPYFMPAHTTSPGTTRNPSENTPTLFRPLKIRGVTFRNRICVSPMCHYSCAPFGPQTGVITPLWYTTIGHYAFKGAALAMLEATGVCPTGRISVNCPGLYNDAQQTGLKGLTDFVHAQGGLIGVQLSHAGRKSSTQAPWVALRQGKSSARADVAQGGWPQDVVAPSGGQQFSWDGKKDEDPTGGFWAPRQITKSEILGLVEDFAKAAQRAVAAGVDVIEIHASHGYLFHQFLSPITNRRTDEYGGSFENRIRIVINTIKAVRQIIPEKMPLFVRVSTTDWMENSLDAKNTGSWDLESTIRFAQLLPGLGVDALDVSSGGNCFQASRSLFDAGRQHVEFAKKIRNAVKESGQNMFIGTVGEITESRQASNIVQDDAGQAHADIISVGRQFLREPGWVLRVAEELGLDAAWPTQIARPQIIPIKVAHKL